MAIKTINEQVTTQLTISFTSGGETTFVNADRTPTLSISKDGDTVHSFSGTAIINDLTGKYYATWTPTVTGEYSAVWSFLVNTISYTQSEAIFVLDAAGAGLTPDAPTPDIGSANTCNITGRFIDAGGNYKKGVMVVFSPISVQEEHTAYGYISDSLSTESDSAGLISFSAVRGVFGLLTITGVGIVRRVTIPDQETIDVFELVSRGEDALQVQTPTFVTLPRRSP